MCACCVHVCVCVNHLTCTDLMLQVLEMVKMVTEKLEAGTYEMPDPSVADCVACQLHLLALLMEVMDTHVYMYMYTCMYMYMYTCMYMYMYTCTHTCTCTYTVPSTYKFTLARARHACDSIECNNNSCALTQSKTAGTKNIYY